MSDNPWEEFGASPDQSSPLTTISHVAHIDFVPQILAEGTLRAGLVYDKSILNDQRILVTWLSPNDWTNAGGFRYGNVRFNFDWDRIIQGRNYYWVESIAYGIPACRILLTHIDRSEALASYDPTSGTGPWVFSSTSGDHLWNGQYCLEIMLESDLSVADAISIDFVKHHPSFCSIDWMNCPDLDLGKDQASARILAATIGGQLDGRKMRPTFIDPDTRGPSSDLQLAYAWICGGLSSSAIRHRGSVGSRSAPAPDLMHAILMAYSRNNLESARTLAGLFLSREEMLRSMRSEIARQYSISRIDRIAF